MSTFMMMNPRTNRAPIHDAALKCDVDIRTALDTFAGPHSSTHAEGQAIFLYFQKVIDAGGFKKFEQAHLARLTKTFAPKLRLPARPARLVAEYWGHAGFY